jgi:hypothetical protein
MFSLGNALGKAVRHPLTRLITPQSDPSGQLPAGVVPPRGATGYREKEASA